MVRRWRAESSRVDRSPEAARERMATMEEITSSSSLEELVAWVPVDREYSSC